MRVQPPHLKRSLAALRLELHAGQPIVVAFGALELRESKLLDKIRAELRGLGAALLLVADGRVLAFRPDDELDAFGSRAELEPAALIELRSACGLGPQPKADRELSLVIITGTGQLVGRHTLQAENGLQALADGLTIAGQAALSARPSFELSRREMVLTSLIGAFALLAAESCHSAAPSTPAPPGPATARPSHRITLNVNGQVPVRRVRISSRRSNARARPSRQASS